ncbi:MAG: dihydropteroate synthase [Nitrososphaerota archaeon]|nr:dihydropteroate synthase [Nitrososphaerota archaeon]MDG6946434.1 dihydropteroate synthase [Nitrososphaerota archaeon]
MPLQHQAIIVTTLKSVAKLGPVRVGSGFPVRIIAAINVSPESFYGGSVANTPEKISAMASKISTEGADILDIGAMSTAPYLKNEISQEVESARIRSALRTVMETGHVTVSVDTLRASVADVALRNGASIINDVSGLKNDAGMARVIKDHGASLLAMAHSSKTSKVAPIARVRQALSETMRIAQREGIDEQHIVLDPGIGFFREEGAGRAYSPQKLMPWYEWDCHVLANLRKLETLRRPLCVGLSRKSFLGKILNLENPEERLPASLAATAVAVMNGANVVRTHDVRETVQAVRIVEAMTRRSRRAGAVS